MNFHYLTILFRIKNMFSNHLIVMFKYYDYSFALIYYYLQDLSAFKSDTMPRNPFTTSKKRKRKPKRVVVKQEPGVPKPFCPRSMVRYDRCHTLQNMTMWTCKRCMTCLLSETAAREHIISCKTPKPPPKPSTSFAEKW